MSATPRRPRPPDGRRPFGLVVVAASRCPCSWSTLDNLVMTNALPVIRPSSARRVEQLQWFVNAYTLTLRRRFILIAAALGDRFGRRTRVPAGHRGLHPRIDRLRAQHGAVAADRRAGPSRASAARRSCRSRSPCSSGRPVPDAVPPPRHRHLGRHLRARRRARPARRRRGRRGHQLAGDLLDQRAGRDHRDPARPRPP